MTVAPHALTRILACPRRPDGIVVSDEIAESVNTNPVVIRRVLRNLRDAVLVASQRGQRAGELAHSPKSITLSGVCLAEERTQRGSPRNPTLPPGQIGAYALIWPSARSLLFAGRSLPPRPQLRDAAVRREARRPRTCGNPMSSAEANPMSPAKAGQAAAELVPAPRKRYSNPVPPEQQQSAAALLSRESLCSCLSRKECSPQPPS
ncbi:Rrf2 family transcriptional regulator [Streptomyces sp. NPDC093984]|uniref:Rrf2 family transcriptional regulator n=1 Tax=Streptomyces sp. NPDC093984 TaxID=3366052 RepID=UPI00382583F8